MCLASRVNSYMLSKYYSFSMTRVKWSHDHLVVRHIITLFRVKNAHDINIEHSRLYLSAPRRAGVLKSLLTSHCESSCICHKAFSQAEDGFSSIYRQRSCHKRGKIMKPLMCSFPQYVGFALRERGAERSRNRV